jgi:uncharacterized protein YjbI with pentapeptide repeats
MALLVIVLISLAAPAMAAPPALRFIPPVPARSVCNGKYKGGRTPSAADLAEILKAHSAWLNDIPKYGRKITNDPRRANLCGANLTDVNLEGANLEAADLGHVLLIGAKLAGADLSYADLAGADLGAADLAGAHLHGGDLGETRFPDADLRGADLGNAHLVYADLADANLNKANLSEADLTNAELGGADLSGAHLAYAVLSWAHMTNTNLENVYLYHAVLTHAEAALVKLRGEFKDMGMRTQEAQLTYAIRRSELNRKTSYYPDGPYVHSWSERYFNTVFLDWTCQYGMSPGRPLLIVAALSAALSIVYIFAQVNPGPNGGIWAVWDEHRIKQTDGSKEPQQLTDGFPSNRSDLSFLLLAFYFSLLSATRIGWRELNVGTWITRIQPRQYSLQATGWVRVVSGVQSLVSVYLVALAILTYFGTPFEY